MLVGAAQQIDPATGVGAKVRVPENVTQAQLGRIAAQTAGQVYRQRLREAERDVVYSQYASREGEIMTGVVHRTTDQAVVLDMGKGVEAVLAVSEQLPGEHYRIGQHLKVYVLEVRRTTRGPVLVVSRTHRGFLRRVMEMEIPEIYNGTVVIRGIAREAGSRSKVAVESRQSGVDAKGAAVGQRGARIQAIVAELNGEKVDVVLWNEDPAQFVAEALSPAEVITRPHRRGAQDRERGRARATALACHRQGGAERAAGRQADRLADRHPVRCRGRARRPMAAARTTAAPTTARFPRRRRSMPKRRPEHQPTADLRRLSRRPPQANDDAPRATGRRIGLGRPERQGPGRGTYICDHAGAAATRSAWPRGPARPRRADRARTRSLAEVTHASA